ncbi:MAG TPA: S8 family serine peptidase, partial [Planctomycetota bacterium]|nr:S8 family serine peptidase [Planctomycetota bacterium]
MQFRLPSQSSIAVSAVTLAVAVISTPALGRQEPLPSPYEPTISFDEANARAAEPRWLSLAYEEFDTRAGEPGVPAEMRLRELSGDEHAYFLVQLDGPVTEAMKAAVNATGAELLDYVPNFAFLTRASTAQLARTMRLPHVVWSGAWHPAYRVEPRLAALAKDPATLQVKRRLVAVVFPGAPLAAVRAQLEALGASIVEVDELTGRAMLTLSATPGEALAMAHVMDVQWIEIAPDGQLRNDTTKWVVQTFIANATRIWTQGLLGAGQIIGHIDGGISTTSCYFSDPAGNPIGPLHRKIVFNSGAAVDSHGTHTAGTACGNAQPVNGSTAGRGMAPLAKIAHSSTFTWTPATTHHNNGARLHTNSWGDDSTTSYNSLCVAIDSFQRSNEDDLAYFAATNTSSLKNPENAKNLLAVGASQNGAGANSFCSGGSGPTADGRRKPEVFSPGCNVVSAGTSSCSTASMTGTSMACPSVTGGGALIREYFMKGFYPSGAAVPGDAFTPSGALIKAVEINGAQDMTGIAGYPSNQEGWGRILLDDSLYFATDAVHLFVDDVRHAPNGLTTGGSKIYALPVVSNAKPLKITLAFCDVAGTSGAGNPVVNDLSLTVTEPNGTTVYRGNVFTSGQSSTGGSSDLKNNVERVIRTSPVAGTWTIRVDGVNVPSGGPQGYALVASGDILAPGGCSGSVTPYCVAKLNSLFCLPAIHGTGTPSASTGSGFLVTCTNVLNNKPGLLLYTVGGRAASPFTGGTLCV